MLGFMDYVQKAFYEASHWNHDNSYSTLTATAQGMARWISLSMREVVDMLTLYSFA